MHLVRGMFHDSVGNWVLVGGASTAILSFAVSPYLGLLPSLITLLIYAHRIYARQRDRALREENERLRKRLAEIEKEKAAQ
jgi:hypothetical protein